MKVLLVIPTFHYTEYPRFLSFSDFPAGFGYLAATLNQAGHEVIGCNPNNIMGYPTGRAMLQATLADTIKKRQPDIIGMGGLCTDYAFLKDAMAICRSLTKAPIILGGQIVSNDAEFIYNDLKPDHAIMGEADWAIVRMVEEIAGGDKPPPVVKSYPKDLDEIPFPDYEPFGIRDMLDNYSMATRLLYRYPRKDPRPFSIVASRSCPFNCTFCVHTRRDIPYRARSIANIMAEIKDTYERYHYNILIILDELFAVNNTRLKQFSEAVLDGKAKYGWDFDWMFQTHASARLELDTLKLAKQAGCFFFSYGLESASEPVLKSMGKKLRIEQVVEAIALGREAGIGFGANLIFGDPAETETTWAESLGFWMKYGQSTMIFLSTLIPYPGSQVFAECQKRGMFQDKRKYYADIDKCAVNMTAIPDYRWMELMNLTAHLEKYWLFVREARDAKVTPLAGSNPITVFEGSRLYEIEAVCPHCGTVSTYHQDIKDRIHPFLFGTGCTKCNQRIKVVIT